MLGLRERAATLQAVRSLLSSGTLPRGRPLPLSLDCACVWEGVGGSLLMANQATRDAEADAETLRQVHRSFRFIGCRVRKFSSELFGSSECGCGLDAAGKHGTDTVFMVSEPGRDLFLTPAQRERWAEECGRHARMAAHAAFEAVPGLRGVEG